MVIYADVLIILNTLVDYFLLKLVSKLSKTQIAFWRICFASLLGGILSLYIFLPPYGVFAEITIRISMALLISITAFGFKNIKYYIRNSLYFFGVTYLYGGIMLGIWFLFKPENIVINNSITYIDISPTVLIISSAAYYFLVMIIKFFVNRNGGTKENCKVYLKLQNKQENITGIIDTGNSLCDIFGRNEIIVVSNSVSDNLLKNISESEKSRRYRAIPIKTVSGTDLLEGFRIDEATISSSLNKKTIKNPIVAVSKVNLDSEWDAIINPRSLI